MPTVPANISKNIHFDAAYSSDTTRAMKTCRYILFENKEYPKTPKRKTLTISANKALATSRETMRPRHGSWSGPFTDAAPTTTFWTSILLLQPETFCMRSILSRMPKEMKTTGHESMRVSTGCASTITTVKKFCWSATASRFAQSLIVMPPSSGQPKTVQEMVPSQNFPFRMTMLKSNTTIIIWITKHTD